MQTKMSIKKKSNVSLTNIIHYILVIVESPSKCKKIEEFLNNIPGKKETYKCIASCGHIRELAGIESIDVHNNFTPTFVECDSKKDIIRKIKSAIVDASEIILASDDDREGEAIAWHICQVFKLPVKHTKRIIFHEITEMALHKAIENPTRVNMSIVNAQIARQVLDMLVGYKLSPILWKHVKDGLSAGRCQTPALRLVYDNQREIDKAEGKQSYTVTGYFTNMNIPFVLNHEEADEKKLYEFLKESLTFSHVHTENKLHNAIKNAPEPFNTSTLQQAASNELNISPKETMRLCQTLYEDGYITYPRTDSNRYSDEFITKANEYIETKYGKESVGANVSVATENAHEAIRTTNLAEIKYVSRDPENNTNKENKLYTIIRRRTLESCMANASISILSCSITAPKNHEYKYKTECVIFPGWKIVNGYETSKEYTYLQALQIDNILNYKKIKANLHVKELKAHYTEARLVSLIEERGIGRPSTFSSLVDKIQERKYVKKENIKGKIIKCTDFEINAGQINKIVLDKEFGNEKNKLVIQPIGILALEFLLKQFEPLFNYSYTKNMEDELDKVSTGDKLWYDVCKKCYTEIEHLSKNIERGKETFRIDDEHTFIIGMNGPVIKVEKNKEITFKAVRSDIDLNKLRLGEYTAETIVEKNNEPVSIGMYLDKPVYVKIGKYGKYLEWNNNKKSLKHLKQELSEITLDDVIEVLYDVDNEDIKILRIINDDASIRKSKYGEYIFYRNKKMKKPRFLTLDGFLGDYLKCDLIVLQKWFTDKYL